MKKTERLLISALWLNAVVLAALWFFNVSFGFNLFSAAHWQYLSDLQLTGKVSQWFFVSAAGVIFVGLAGLYLLVIPWHRKIKVSPADIVAIDIPQKATQQVASFVPQPGPELARPPRLNLNSSFMPNRREEIMIPKSDSAPVQPSFMPRPITAVPVAQQNKEQIQKIRDTFLQAGFVLKNSMYVSGIKVDFVAAGAGEILVLGLFLDESGDIVASEGGQSLWHSSGRPVKSPAWQMTDIVAKVQSLLIEAVPDDLKINLLPFVYSTATITNKDSVRPVWDALGINVFDNFSDFEDFVKNNSPSPTDLEEKEVFDAFSGLVDSVMQYFNGGA